MPDFNDGVLPSIPFARVTHATQWRARLEVDEVFDGTIVVCSLAVRIRAFDTARSAAAAAAARK